MTTPPTTAAHPMTHCVIRSMSFPQVGYSSGELGPQLSLDCLVLGVHERLGTGAAMFTSPMVRLLPTTPTTIPTGRQEACGRFYMGGALMIRQPYSSMVAEPSGGMTVVAVASSTMAGPSMAQPGIRYSRWNRAVG